MLVRQTLTAGQRLEFIEPGDFFRLLSATASVTVEFYRQGKEIAEAIDIGAGYAERFQADQFDRIAITSATAQTIQFVTRLGNVVNYDAPPAGNVVVTGGNVAVVNNNGTFTQSQRSISNTSMQLVGINTNRRYLLVQNKDSTGFLYINMNGTPATVSNGLAIPPGGSLEFSGYVPTNAIEIVGDIASNPNVIHIEG